MAWEVRPELAWTLSSWAAHRHALPVMIGSPYSLWHAHKPYLCRLSAVGPLMSRSASSRSPFAAAPVANESKVLSGIAFELSA